MRKIKFRFWDKKANGMASWDEINMLETDGLLPFLTVLDDEERYIVMQFTGLQDRNGKDIYEGDIIRIGHPHKGRSYIGPIVYESYRFTAKDFYFPHHDDPGNPFESLDYMEIIGNIYENPSLLEATP